jgi:hypothetical protein
MLRELFEYVVGLGDPKPFTYHELPYTSRPLHLVMPPSRPFLAVGTLTGLVDAVKALALPETHEAMLLVSSHRSVSLVPIRSDEFGRRDARIVATVPQSESLFTFNRFLDRESFVIGLQSMFVDDDALKGVLSVASALQAEAVAISEDDGISQKTTIKRGVAALKQQVIVKGRVTLRPYRTFREVEQPASDFIFRLRSDENQVPECALFEADGGKWQLDAMLTIRTWLEDTQLGVPVVA